MSIPQWQSRYKTTINGEIVTFGELFQKSGTLNFGSLKTLTSSEGGDKFKYETTSGTSKNFTTNPNHFSADYHGPAIANTSHYNIGTGSSVGIANNDFNDKQVNVGYKYNGSDIGPECCAKFYEYTSSSSNIGNFNNLSVPTWVDYYKGVIVGRGGQLGHGRWTNDQHVNAPTGGCGGFAVWETPKNLGKRNCNVRYYISTIGWAEFKIFSSNGNEEGYIQCRNGSRGNTVTGNDDDDTHTGWDSIGGGQGGYVFHSNGNLIYYLSKNGDYAHINSTHPGTNKEQANYSPNTIQTLVNCWGSASATSNNPGYGRPASWVHNANYGNVHQQWNHSDIYDNCGDACIRYYPIAYDEHS